MLQQIPKREAALSAASLFGIWFVLIQVATAVITKCCFIAVAKYVTANPKKRGGAQRRLSFWDLVCLNTSGDSCNYQVVSSAICLPSVCKYSKKA